MVIKHQRPDGTGGAIVRPYTRADRLYMEEMLARDHGGPYAMIHSRPRNAAPAASATNRQTQATSQSTAEAAADPAQPDQPQELGREEPRSALNPAAAQHVTN